MYVTSLSLNVMLQFHLLYICTSNWMFSSAISTTFQASKLTIETQEQGVKYVQSYTPCSSISSVNLQQVNCQLSLTIDSLEAFIISSFSYHESNLPFTISSFSYHESNLPLIAQGVMRLLAIHQFVRVPIWFKSSSPEQICYKRLKHMESGERCTYGRAVTLADGQLYIVLLESTDNFDKIPTILQCASALIQTILIRVIDISLV